MVKRGRPEDDEMRFHVMPLYSQCGFHSYTHATRNKPVGVTPGIADLEIFAPLFGFRFVHEVKIKHDRQSHEQKKYQEACEGCGIAYVLGDREAAEDFLVWIGVARWEPRGMLAQSPRPTPAQLIAIPREHRLFLFNHHRPMSPIAGSSWREQVSKWNATPAAIAHNKRWGWNATPAQLRGLAR